jgi:hypothetical protein
MRVLRPLGPFLVGAGLGLFLVALTIAVAHTGPHEMRSLWLAVIDLAAGGILTSVGLCLVMSR